MKNKITIYTNFTQKNFLKSILTNFKLDFKKLDEASISKSESDKILFFLPQDLNQSSFNKYLETKNVLLIIPQNSGNLIKINNNPFLMYPTSIDKFKNKIYQTFFFRKDIFGCLEIFDQKIMNTTNNKFCFLTNLEKEIFSELVHEKSISRQFVEENILNINPKAETRSLDSHLSRIRKKLQYIDSKVKIISKGKDIKLQN